MAGLSFAASVNAMRGAQTVTLELEAPTPRFVHRPQPSRSRLASKLEAEITDAQAKAMHHHKRAQLEQVRNSAIRAKRNPETDYNAWLFKEMPLDFDNEFVQKTRKNDIWHQIWDGVQAGDQEQHKYTTNDNHLDEAKTNNTMMQSIDGLNAAVPVRPRAKTTAANFSRNTPKAATWSSHDIASMVRPADICNAINTTPTDQPLGSRTGL